MMKKLLLVGCMLLPFVGAAHAQIFLPWVTLRPYYTPYYHYKNPSKWHAYPDRVANDSQNWAGAPMCIMETKWNNADLRLQWVYGKERIEFMITKAGWHFADNMSVPGSIAFDHELFGHVSGSTWSWRNTNRLTL
jgi:hypothetical protein